MAAAANNLVGEHDFRNFCKLDVNATHWTRKIISIDIKSFSENTLSSDVDEKESPNSASKSGLSHTCYVCTIQGSGFLWHQIRCIMYLLFLVGTGRESPEVTCFGYDDLPSM